MIAGTAPEKNQVNLGDPDFWLRDAAESELAELRAASPVIWQEHPECGRGFWAILKYQDMDEVSRTPTVFSSRYGIRVHHDAGSDMVRPGTSAMTELDGAEHARHRRIISQAFTPRTIANIEHSIEAAARDIVAGLRDRDSVDFVDGVAAILPVQIICDMLGVPNSDRPLVYNLTNLTMGDQDPEVGGTPAEGTNATRQLQAYGRELAHERRRHPGEDLFSLIATAPVEGEGLADTEMGAFFSLLIAAGNETTRTAMTHGMWAYSVFPDQKRRYLADPGKVERTATEEILRWATPVRHVARVVTCDTTFRGVQMQEGEKVAMWYQSANRDEEIFPGPEMFDVTRSPNRHVSFGTGGPHFCLGANLARREISIMFRELFEAFPKITATAPPRRLRSLLINGITSLPVSLTG
jgi:cytochrome P450